MMVINTVELEYDENEGTNLERNEQTTAEDHSDSMKRELLRQRVGT